MLPEDSEIGRLIEATSDSLVPAPFPPRRDLEYAGSRSAHTGGAVLFHDAFWTRQFQFSCYVVRLDDVNAHRAIAAAHLLKPLVRTAMRLHEAERALALSTDALEALDFPIGYIDIAASTLQVDTGEASFGVIGPGAGVDVHRGFEAGCGNGSFVRERRIRLVGGERIRLSVGDAAAPAAAAGNASLSDAKASVRAALSGSRSAAVALVELKSLRKNRGRTFTLTNDVSAISGVIIDTMDYLLSQGIRPESVPGLDFALDELLTNTVLYAFDDGGAHEIIVHVQLQGNVVRIKVQDDGVPFDPTAQTPVDLTSDVEDRPIGGLGLHLIRTVFDTSSYRRVEGWNSLTFTKIVVYSLVGQRDAPNAEL